MTLWVAVLIVILDGLGRAGLKCSAWCPRPGILASSCTGRGLILRVLSNLVQGVRAISQTTSLTTRNRIPQCARAYFDTESHLLMGFFGLPRKRPILERSAATAAPRRRIRADHLTPSSTPRRVPAPPASKRSAGRQFDRGTPRAHTQPPARRKAETRIRLPIPQTMTPFGSHPGAGTTWSRTFCGVNDNG